MALYSYVLFTDPARGFVPRKTFGKGQSYPGGKGRSEKGRGNVSRRNVPQAQIRAERPGLGRAGSRATPGRASVALHRRQNVRGSHKRPGGEGDPGAGIVPTH